MSDKRVDQYREVDVVCLRSELSKHPSFFDREELVDSVVSLVINDFPEAITPEAIRQAVEEVRAEALVAFRIIHKGADNVETAATNAALDALLALLVEREP